MTIGFIKLHRKITDWEWYSDVNTCRLFLHLLLTAKFKDEKWRGIDIKRGQVLTGRMSLAKSTSLTESQIRTAISKLKSTNEISIKITSEFSIITLTNYDLYQSRSEINDQQNDQPLAEKVSSQSPTNDQPIATDKQIQEEQELKRIEEEKKLLIENQFKSFWESYKAIHTGKGVKKEANQAFLKALKKTSFGEIEQGLKNYMAECHSKNIYTKQVSVWLNKECWNGDYSTPSQKPIIPSNPLIEKLNSIAGKDLFKKTEISYDQILLRCHNVKLSKEAKQLPVETKEKIKEEMLKSFPDKTLTVTY